MNDQESREMLEKYIQGLLSAEERLAIEKRLEQDPTLRNELNILEKVYQGVEAFGLKQDLKKIHQNLHTSKSSTKRLSPPIYLRVAAIGLLLIGMMYVFFLLNQQNKPLFEQYFQPYPNIISNRSVQDSILGQAMIYYTQQQYSQAIQIFERLKLDSEKEESKLFYQSLSYLALNQAEKAINILQILKKSADVYTPQATWYLALAYLKTKNYEACKAELKNIKPNAYNFQEAQSLLQKLE